MTMTNFTEQIREQLKAKIDEQINLTNREAFLSERAALTKSDRIRLKSSVDRQVVGTRLSRLNAEIMGLAKML